MEWETTTAPLISHALAPMLNEKGVEGWELTGVEDGEATFRRPVPPDGPWEYATVPLIPAARDAILAQWTARGYELTLEVDGVAYLARRPETT